jgi:prepilin-type N-terminal cleavage/methylation domain-containing protein
MKSRANGFSLVEVMMALVILGVISVIFLQTTRMSQKNTGKARDWQIESLVIEKTIENLRVDKTLAQMQILNTQSVDSSQGGKKVRVTVRGDLPPASIATNFPREALAQLTVSACRVGETDSLEVTTFVWVN